MTEGTQGEGDRSRRRPALPGRPPLSIFVSYSHEDTSFVENLERKLRRHRIRCWLDVREMRAGRIESQIREAIAANVAVLLVLSMSSIRSDWVAWEAEWALEEGQQSGRDVLCPVALDSAWKRCSWSRQLQDQIRKYYVQDFSSWRDQEAFDESVLRLAEGLWDSYAPFGDPHGGLIASRVRRKHR